MTGRSIMRLEMQAITRIRHDHVTLIDRYAGRIDHAHQVSYRIPDRFPGGQGTALLLLDADNLNNGMLPIASRHAALWHVLWVRDEPGATATVGSPPGSSTWSIAPGDSLLVPEGTALNTTGGQLGILFATSSNRKKLQMGPPTHGVDDFHGYNRRTVYPSLGPLAIHRWKITQPLELSSQYQGTTIVMSLAGDAAITTPTESLPMHRGQALLVNLDQRTTIYPDSLGYVLVIQPMTDNASSL